KIFICESPREVWKRKSRVQRPHSYQLLQRLGHKNCRTCFLLQGIALKTGRLIHANGLMIFVHHFQRQLATTKFPCLGFDRLQQPSPNAFAARRREDHEVVNIDDWFGSEARETDETHGRSNRLNTIKCQEDQRRRMSPSPGYKSISPPLIKRLSITHGVS